MNPKKQGDTAYRFDRAVADTSAEAKAVLKIVDHMAAGWFGVTRFHFVGCN